MMMMMITTMMMMVSMDKGEKFTVYKKPKTQ